jgi:HlyD family secretion protein
MFSHQPNIDLSTMHHRTHIRILTGPALVVLALGCSKPQEAPVYQMIPVATRDIVLSASAAGAIEPVQTVEVKSKASGEIREVAVEVGDVVRRGQLLVRVDQRVPHNAVVQAEADSQVAQAQLDIAESQFVRSQKLFETQSITEQEFENARLARANANAQLVRSQRQLEDARIAFEDTEVRAPTDGVILSRAVEVGTVIQSASSGLSGGAVLLKMANLDTVQVRTLVDETDIGKINSGLGVTITVDAYPNQPFQGRVLKIEPEALVQQNVTMFPVLIRIANQRSLLKPGMNAEVEIHIGSAPGVLAIPNAALRTQRDYASAARVLGLDVETVRQQLADAREHQSDQAQRTTLGGNTVADSSEETPATTPAQSNTISIRGREVQLPPDIKREQIMPILSKMENGGFQNLTADERALLGRVMRPAGGSGGRGGFGGRDAGNRSENHYQFGGEYIVFVMKQGVPTAALIQTGLTDLDYSEVRSGLTASDTVLILPSASLLQNQQEFQERINRMTGGGLPGVSRTPGR